MTSADTQDDRQQLLCVRVGGWLNYVYQEKSEHIYSSKEDQKKKMEWRSTAVKKKKAVEVLSSLPFLTQYTAKLNSHE